MKFIFHLDGVITSEKTIPFIAKHFNVFKQIEKITRDTHNGQIPFVESFITRIGILKAFPVSEISAVLKKIRLHRSLLEFVQTNRDDCVVVTGNLKCWVKDLTDKIGCQSYFSEALVEDDKVVSIVKILKIETVVKYYQECGERVVYIGDGINSMEAMRISDLSIAAGLSQPPVKSILPFSDYLVLNEKALCRQLNQLL
jgi:phosphoserine phosphatase